MPAECILIVEDERAVARGLEYGLESEMYTSATCVKSWRTIPESHAGWSLSAAWATALSPKGHLAAPQPLSRLLQTSEVSCVGSNSFGRCLLFRTLNTVTTIL